MFELWSAKYRQWIVDRDIRRKVKAGTPLEIAQGDADEEPWQASQCYGSQKLRRDANKYDVEHPARNDEELWMMTAWYGRVLT